MRANTVSCDRSDAELAHLCACACVRVQDGECDASHGLFARCPRGTDWLDCDPCSSKEDGTYAIEIRACSDDGQERKSQRHSMPVH